MSSFMLSFLFSSPVSVVKALDFTVKAGESGWQSWEAGEVILKLASKTTMESPLKSGLVPVGRGC